MMKNLQAKLSTISGGKVLDVGIGRGQFAWIMADSFKDYEEIIGIDVNPKILETAGKNLKQFNVTLELMSGSNIEFEDNSFDTVSIAQTIHHIPSKDEINNILMGMKRVLKPGGLFIIKEMFSDNKEEAQLSIVEYHHWIADIDRILGKNHFRTFKKQEIIDMTMELSLKDLETFEFLFDEKIEAEDEEFQRFFNKIDKRTESVKGYVMYEDIKKRGEAIKERVLKTGLSYEKEIIIMGRK